jgi:hypothetical protein
MKNKTLILYVLLTIPVAAMAQRKYTVVFPEVSTSVPKNDRLTIAATSVKDSSWVICKFGTYVMPLNTIIKELTFRLYDDDTKKLPSFNQIAYLSRGDKLPDSWVPQQLNDGALRWVTEPDKKVGFTTITSKTSLVNFELDTASFTGKFANSAGNMTLAARSPSKRLSSSFYGKSAAISGADRQPKLIVGYNINNDPYRNDWAQKLSTPQHDNYYYWGTSGETRQVEIKSLNAASYETVGITGALCVFKNNPIVFVRKDGRAVVEQLNSGGEVAWEQAMSDDPKFSPVIDERGRMYYFTASTFSVLDLNAQGKFLVNGQSLPDFIGAGQILTSPPTIGYDGTVYLSSGKTITALSILPQTAVRWQRNAPLSERFGPVSLSKDERKAFAIMANSDQNQSSLVMLANEDGTLTDTTPTWSGAYKAGENSLIPSAVITGDSTITVLDGFDAGKTLLSFAFKGKFGKAETISSKDGATGLSQPAADPKGNMFFIADKKLTVKSGSGKIEANEGDFSGGSVLIIDAKDHIYVFDPYNGQLAGFKFEGQKLTRSFTWNNGSSFNFLKNAVLSPNGIIYSVTNSDLKAIVPQQFSDAELTIDLLRPKTVYRANGNIYIAGLKAPTFAVNAIISSAGGDIVLKPNFSVNIGAQLTFLTGK